MVRWSKDEHTRSAIFDYVSAMIAEQSSSKTARHLHILWVDLLVCVCHDMTTVSQSCMPAVCGI